MYEKFSDRALLDMLFVESLREDKTEAEAIQAELDRRLKPKKEVDDNFWF